MVHTYVIHSYAVTFPHTYVVDILIQQQALRKEPGSRTSCYSNAQIRLLAKLTSQAEVTAWDTRLVQPFLVTQPLKVS